MKFGKSLENMIEFSRKFSKLYLHFENENAFHA